VLEEARNVLATAEHRFDRRPELLAGAFAAQDAGRLRAHGAFDLEPAIAANDDDAGGVRASATVKLSRSAARRARSTFATSVIRMRRV
jgi:hypothetical protein